MKTKATYIFESTVIAGIFMAKLATKFGTQSNIYTFSGHYEVQANIGDNIVISVNAYYDGLVDGIGAVKELK